MPGSEAGAAREEWETLARRVRAAASPDESPALGALYQLALRDGVRALAGFTRLSADERVDLVAEKFVSERVRIVEAGNPRGFFLTAVIRSATSALRRKQTADKHQAELSWVSDGTPRTEGDTVTTLDLAHRLRQLSPRDQQLLRAVHEGEGREDVARCFDTSRANVDQIVSRAARKKGDE